MVFLVILLLLTYFFVLDAVIAAVGQNRATLRILSECVDKHLDMCGHRWVDLKGLFSFMKI